MTMIETSSWWRSVPPTLGNPGDRRVTERKIIIVIITILVLISLASMIWLLFGRCPFFYWGASLHGWIVLLMFPLIATDCPLQTDAPVILGLHTIKEYNHVSDFMKMQTVQLYKIGPPTINFPVQGLQGKEGLEGCWKRLLVEGDVVDDAIAQA